jgi:hypothetical protein
MTPAIFNLNPIWTGAAAIPGSGRKVGPPLAPPGQVVKSPGKAEGRHVGPVETAHGQAKEQPKKGEQKGDAKPHLPAKGRPAE